MTGSIASFSGMAIAVRELKGAHDTFEIMAVRSLVGLVIVVVLAAPSAGSAMCAPTGWAAPCAQRDPFHRQNLWIWAVTVIPLAQVFALEFTSPVWVLILSPLLLGERITRLRVMAALYGFVGILIVARPISRREPRRAGGGRERAFLRAHQHLDEASDAARGDRVDPLLAHPHRSLCSAA